MKLDRFIYAGPRIKNKINSPLTVIIGESFDWKKWWNENRGTLLDMDIRSTQMPSEVLNLIDSLDFLRESERESLKRTEKGIEVIEPETLHPEKQVRLLEALAIIANMGIQVVIVTHSWYILSHLNNLVVSAEKGEDFPSQNAEKLYLKDSRAFVQKWKAHAYELKEDKLLDLFDPDYGFVCHSLCNVSVEIQQKYFAMNS